MKTKCVVSPCRLSDRELVDRVKHLACRERQATASLVGHLAELDERRLYLAEGCSSLFTYCTEVLHLSEDAAFSRIEAARASRKFPLVIEKLADGSVHLTGIRLLAPHLTEENHQELLKAATHKTKREVDEIVARLRPLPAVSSFVRRLPAARAVAECAVVSSGAGPALDFGAAVPSMEGEPVSASRVAAAGNITAAGNVSLDGSDSNNPAATQSPRRAKVVPLAAELYAVQFTADAETHTLLSQARELLRHQVPDGDTAAIMKLALKLLVEKKSREKFCAKKRTLKRRAESHAPKRTRKAASQRPGSRYIPAGVKRKVWRRDEGRCAFTSKSGRRCSERGQLEFHHVKPFAIGGPATIDNIELRCRAHNTHEAELIFGERSGRKRVGLEQSENVMCAPPAAGRRRANLAM